MKKYIVLLGVLCMSLCVGCGDKEVAEPVDVPVAVVENVLEVDGEVCTNETEEIYIDFPAKIEKVHVVEGQVLSKDAPLFTLDTTSYEDQVKLKESNIAVMEAELRGMQSQANPLTAELSAMQDELNLKEGYKANNNAPQIKVLQANLEISESDLAKLKEEYKINEELYKNDAIAEKELKDLASNIQNKEKERDNIKTNIESLQTDNALEITNLQSKIKSTQMQISEEDRELASQIEVAKLKLQVAKEELDILKRQYDDVYIKDGQLLASKDKLLVYDIGCAAGTQVSNNAQLLARCVDTTKLIVTLDIPSEDALQIKVGDKVTLDVYTDQSEGVTGEICRLSDRAVIIDGDSYIKADVTPKEGAELLKLGAKLDATIELN